jgi:hypothetical protein
VVVQIGADTIELVLYRDIEIVQQLGGAHAGKLQELR